MSEREKFEDEETSADPNLGEKQADIIAAIANAAELFHDPDNITYATIKQDGHKETWPVRSKTFRHWLLLRFFQLENTAPDPTALKSGIAVIEARARFVGAERQVHIRTAEHSNKIYLDLVDQRWRVVEIDANGWRVLENCPVKFRRSAGMTSLPVPIAGGTLNALHSCLNVSDIDLVLVAAWLIAALRPRGPYPILVLNGEQGSAKSTFARILRDLIDPNSVPLRALPQGERDLFIAATNGYVINFDNISGLPTWLSDALCRISTGGGWACRALYTDQDGIGSWMKMRTSEPLGLSSTWSR